jgi:hypothetical protein
LLLKQRDIEIVSLIGLVHTSLMSNMVKASVAEWLRFLTFNNNWHGSIPRCPPQVLSTFNSIRVLFFLCFNINLFFGWQSCK